MTVRDQTRGVPSLRSIRIRYGITVALIAAVALATVLGAVGLAITLGMTTVAVGGSAAMSSSLRQLAAQADVQDVERLHRLVSQECKRLQLEKPRTVLIEQVEPNASATRLFDREGSGRIVVTSGVLQCMTDDQVAAVLRHELSHYVHADTSAQLRVALPSILFTATIVAALNFVHTMLAVTVGLIVGAVLVQRVTALRKRFELRADADAIGSHAEGVALADGLIEMHLHARANFEQSEVRQMATPAGSRLLRRHPMQHEQSVAVTPCDEPESWREKAIRELLNPRPQPWLVSQFSAYPPLAERIALIQERSRAAGTS